MFLNLVLLWVVKRQYSAHYFLQNKSTFLLMEHIASYVYFEILYFISLFDLIHVTVITVN